MLNTFLNFFRKRKLKRYASDRPTGFLPLSDITSANVVIDVEEPGFDVLKEDILAWGRQNGIKVSIFFFDFRKLGKEELLLTSIQTTLLRRELDWLGTPDMAKIAPLINEESDLFISLVDNGDFPIGFISTCARARFKIGRHGYEGHPFNMVVTGGPTAELRSESKLVFAKMTEMLTMVK